MRLYLEIAVFTLIIGVIFNHQGLLFLSGFNAILAMGRLLHSYLKENGAGASPTKRCVTVEGEVLAKNTDGNLFHKDSSPTG